MQRIIPTTQFGVLVLLALLQSCSSCTHAVGNLLLAARFTRSEVGASKSQLKRKPAWAVIPHPICQHSVLAQVDHAFAFPRRQE